ncbi:MAG TPA: hypothetical protein VN812_04910 [Candidatus Acidoferrales bacterium]|nr:hypothetical protein [Candidatus Acidoferrales bacterium]
MSTKTPKMLDHRDWASQLGSELRMKLYERANFGLPDEDAEVGFLSVATSHLAAAVEETYEPRLRLPAATIAAVRRPYSFWWQPIHSALVRRLTGDYEGPNSLGQVRELMSVILTLVGHDGDGLRYIRSGPGKPRRWRR